MKTSSALPMIFIGFLVLSACDKKPERGMQQTQKAQDSTPPQSAAHNDANSFMGNLDVGQAMVLSSVEILKKDPAHTALSKNEAEWLAKSGFLTEKEIASLRFESSDELLARARDQADLKSRTKLGVKRLQEGDYRGAARALDVAAREGSVYALEQLAIAELADARKVVSQNDRATREAVEAAFVARMEQAKILGDHRAGQYIERANLGIDREKMAPTILAQTTEFMRQYNEDAVTKNKIRSITPRPNQELWQSLIANQNNTANAYTR